MFDDDDFDDMFKKIEDIMNRNFSSGYIPRKVPIKTDYGADEEGVLYADRELEILDFDKYVSITMDLQGVRDEDLIVKPEEKAVIISYMFEGLWRKKPLNLPYKINPKTAKISFNNCILDIELEKVKDIVDERFRGDKEISRE